MYMFNNCRTSTTKQDLITMNSLQILGRIKENGDTLRERNPELLNVPADNLNPKKQHNKSRNQP